LELRPKPAILFADDQKVCKNSAAGKHSLRVFIAISELAHNYFKVCAQTCGNFNRDKNSPFIRRLKAATANDNDFTTTAYL
jgi:hypothetical protein